MVQLNLLRCLGIPRPFRDSDIAAAPAIVHGEVSYGVLWDPSVLENIGAVEQLLQHLGSDSECFHLAGKIFPAELARLAARGEARESLCCCALWRVLLQVAPPGSFSSVGHKRFSERISF